jgi:HK97 family phage prohead protease
MPEASKREKRFFAGEVRVAPKADTPADSLTLPVMLSGSAAVYNTPSLDFGDWYEIIEPGAFTESLKTCDLRCLDEHDSAKLLGRASAGTLRFTDSAKSLDIENDPPNVSYGRDLVVLLTRRDKTGMSFWFEVEEDCWSIDKDGRSCRRVAKAKIMEVSFVTFPAYDKTEAEVSEASQRSFQDWKRSQAPTPTASDEWYLRRQKLNEVIHKP